VRADPLLAMAYAGAGADPPRLICVRTAWTRASSSSIRKTIQIAIVGSIQRGAGALTGDGTIITGVAIAILLRDIIAGMIIRCWLDCHHESKSGMGGAVQHITCALRLRSHLNYYRHRFVYVRRLYVARQTGILLRSDNCRLHD
jgi:hypothetical protein